MIELKNMANFLLMISFLPFLIKFNRLALTLNISPLIFRILLQPNIFCSNTETHHCKLWNSTLLSLLGGLWPYFQSHTIAAMLAK